MPEFTKLLLLLQKCTVLIIGVSKTNYFVNEGDRNVTLTVLMRGGVNECNSTEWSLNYIVYHTKYFSAM